MKPFILILSFFFVTTASGYELFFERDASVPLVQITIAVKGGVSADPKSKSGITNFVCDLMSRGTKNRSKQEIDLEFDQLGGTFGCETRQEFIAFRGSVLSKNLQPYLALVKEILLHPNFSAPEIQKLKSETLSQILQSLNNDMSLVRIKLAQFLFGDHPYGRFVLGSMRDVQTFTQDELNRHHQLIMRSPHLIVLGTGDAQESEIRDWAKDLASSLPQDNKAVPVGKPDIPPGVRVLIVDKPDLKQTQIAVGQAGIVLTDPRYHALTLANHAYGGGGFQTRMMQELRVKRGWTYGASSTFQVGTQPRAWTFGFFPKTEQTPEALSFALQMVKDFKNIGITPDEYSFAKQSYVNSAGFSYNTPKKRMENFLLETILKLPKGFFRSLGPKVEQVSESQVNQAVKSFVDTENYSIVIVGTAAKIKEGLAKTLNLPLHKIVVQPYTAE